MHRMLFGVLMALGFSQLSLAAEPRKFPEAVAQESGNGGDGTHAGYRSAAAVNRVEVALRRNYQLLDGLAASDGEDVKLFFLVRGLQQANAAAEGDAPTHYPRTTGRYVEYAIERAEAAVYDTQLSEENRIALVGVLRRLPNAAKILGKEPQFIPLPEPERFPKLAAALAAARPKQPHGP